MPTARSKTPLIDRLSELTDKARELAIEQAWSIDWTELAAPPQQAGRESLGPQ